VDGNGTRLIGNSISNGRGMPCSIQEDSCATSKELVHVAFDKPPSLETSSEQETLRVASSRPYRQSRLLNGFEETNKRNLNAM